MTDSKWVIDNGTPQERKLGQIIVDQMKEIASLEAEVSASQEAISWLKAERDRYRGAIERMEKRIDSDGYYVNGKLNPDWVAKDMKEALHPKRNEQGEQECMFPDCGCPEARLCMSGNPNEGALSLINRPIKK